MPGVDVLFDTNAVIAWMRRDRNLAEATPPDGAPALSLFALAELRFGAKNSSRSESNLAALDKILANFRLILPDAATADVYADIALLLRRKGRPIPTNDLWIAALALQHRLPLLTRDAHFREVNGLVVLQW